MSIYNLRWQWHDKIILSTMFVLFDRPLASFTNNITYINWMAVVKVSSQGDFFLWMAKLLATEAIKSQVNSEVQCSYQLEIPRVVSHNCQDQDAKSLNTVNKVPYTFRWPECVMNCIDFSSLKWLLSIWWKRSKITIQLDVVFTLHC